MKLARLFSLVLLGGLLFLLARPTHAQTELTAPDGSAVSIYRDSFGVPHIVAETEAGVFFGQGYAIAEDRLYQMDLWARTGQGRVGELLGNGSYFVLDQYWRRTCPGDSERYEQFLELPQLYRDDIVAYGDGVNARIDSVNADPTRLLPTQYDTLSLEPWKLDKTLATIMFMGRTFGLAGGQELQRLRELQENGQAWFEANRPINDPSAPTTIHDNSAPLPRTWHYRGMTVDPSVVDRLAQDEATLRAASDRLHIPPHFGSFAALVSPNYTASGSSMMIGGPQFGIPDEGWVNVAVEADLVCPSFHCSGMAFAGMPGLIVGRTDDFAWTFCSGKSDNRDVYIDSVETTAYTRSWYNGAWHPIETIVDTIYSTDFRPSVFRHYRTVHGPVFGSDFENHQIFSYKTSFDGRELNFQRMVFDMNRATTRDEFRDALRDVPISFNISWAARNGDLFYMHIGLYQDRSDGVDPRLPHRGDGTEEWGGFVSFESLPYADASRQPTFANWNNKPAPWWDNGDAVPWVGPHPVTRIQDYLDNHPDFTFENLRSLPERVTARGSYTAMIAWEDPLEARNLCPPGQSGFISLEGVPSPHLNDQMALNNQWDFKYWLYGAEDLSAPMRREKLPIVAGLESVYPNPFNPSSVAVVNLDRPSTVTLRLYNLMGRQVACWQHEDAAPPAVRFTIDGHRLASGVYFLQAEINGTSQPPKRITLLR